MSKSKKILLGILTFLPVLLMVVYFYYFFAIFSAAFDEMSHSGNHEEFPTVFGHMRELFVLVFAMIITSFGLLIYYIIHAVRNKKLSDSQRTMWILIIVLASGIGSIVYFFVEIVPQTSSDKESLSDPTEHG